MGEHKVYGYVTATRIKVVVILRDDYDRVSDTDVRGLFRERRRRDARVQRHDLLRP